MPEVFVNPTVLPRVRADADPEGLVSIIVACCGQLEYTRLCVASLLQHSRHPYELLFLDSGSLDGTAHFLAGVAVAANVRVEVVRVSPDPVLEKTENESLIEVRGDSVVLLNNDTIVTPGWLEGLLNLACGDSAIGLVAPMSNYAAPGQVVDPVPYQVVAPTGESFLKRDCRPDLAKSLAGLDSFARSWAEKHRGKGFEATDIGGGCFLVKRTALQAVGIFPTRTPLGTFDHENLCQRLRQAGLRTVVCRGAFVHNFGSRVPSGISTTFRN